MERSERVEFRATRAEVVEIDRRAAALGLGRSEYVRVRALGESRGDPARSWALAPTVPLPAALGLGRLRDAAPVGSLLKGKGGKK